LQQGGPKGPPFHIDRDQSTRRVQDAQTKIDRSNDHATPRTRRDHADAGAARDAICGKAGEDAATETTANKDASHPRRQSENNAQELAAQAAGCPKGQPAPLVSGVDIPIKGLKVRHPLHRQAVLVLFARDVHFHQMLGKPFTGTPGLGTVCKRAVYVERAIDRQTSHWIASGWFEPFE